MKKISAYEHGKNICVNYTQSDSKVYWFVGEILLNFTDFNETSSLNFFLQ